MKAEIQIRTFSQHVWSASSHLPQPYDTMVSELFENSIETSGQLKQLLEEQMSCIEEKESLRRKEYGYPFYSFAGLLRIALSETDSKNIT